jgi:hypothetical protein
MVYQSLVYSLDLHLIDHLSYLQMYKAHQILILKQYVNLHNQLMKIASKVFLNEAYVV